MAPLTTGVGRIATELDVIDGTDVVVTLRPVDTLSIMFPAESVVETVKELEVP